VTLGIKKEVFALVLGLLFYSSPCFSQRMKFLKNDWMVFDQQSTFFYPYITGNENKLPLHLKIDASLYNGLCLSVISKKPVSLYVASCFAIIIPQNVAKLVSIDSLSKLYGNDLLLSFYGDYNQVLIDSISIVANKNLIIVNEGTIQSVPLARTSNFSRNYFTLLLLISIGFLASIRSIYSKIFDQYLSFVGTISDSPQSANSKVSFESYNFVFIFLGIVFFALACVSLSIFDNNQVRHTFSDFFGGILSLMFTVFIFYLLKFITTYIASWLFSVNKFATSHFLIFVRVSILWSISLVILSMLKYSDIEWIQSQLLSLFFFTSIFFLTLISVKVSLLINRVTKISRLYLISYLCITEWLPYFVILKLYMIYFY
jgi:hypothetical protein